MTSEQTAIIRKAQESLEAARLLAGKGFFSFAASRSYYDMFYIAEALLLGEGLTFSKTMKYDPFIIKIPEGIKHGTFSLAAFCVRCFIIRIVGGYEFCHSSKVQQVGVSLMQIP